MIDPDAILRPTQLQIVIMNSAPKGNLMAYPPLRPGMPYIVIRFSGYGIHCAAAAKSEEAARAMLKAHEEGVAAEPSKPRTSLGG